MFTLSVYFSVEMYECVHVCVCLKLSGACAAGAQPHMFGVSAVS